jgi:hypothetical protein
MRAADDGDGDDATAVGCSARLPLLPPLAGLTPTVSPHYPMLQLLLPLLLLPLLLLLMTMMMVALVPQQPLPRSLRPPNRALAFSSGAASPRHARSLDYPWVAGLLRGVAVCARWSGQPRMTSAKQKAK